MNCFSAAQEVEAEAYQKATALLQEYEKIETSESGDSDVLSQWLHDGNF
jgi:hypothetical protein